jgi:hypothetical protein
MKTTVALTRGLQLPPGCAHLLPMQLHSDQGHVNGGKTGLVVIGERVAC